MKISPTAPFSSGSAACTVNTRMPKGGVSSPVSMARMPRMAKASGSKPAAAAIGANTGTVSRMMEIESMMQPSTNQTATMSARIANGPKPEPRIRSCAALVTPVMASTRE